MVHLYMSSHSLVGRLAITFAEPGEHLLVFILLIFPFNSSSVSRFVVLLELLKRHLRIKVLDRLS